MSFLPFTTLQATYPEVFNDVSTSLLESDAVWLSIYQGNAPNASIHSKLTLTACKEDPSDPNTDSGVKIEKLQVKGTERLKVDRLGKSRLSLEITLPSSSSDSISSATINPRQLHSQIAFPSTSLLLPRRTLSCKSSSGPGALGITALDLSPSNGLLVLGGEDGWLEVRNLNQWDGANESGSSKLEEKEENLENERFLSDAERIEALAQRRIREKLGSSNGSGKDVIKLKGHQGDIRSVKFFPSGEVILSTSSDSTARIFSALDGSNPRALKGHKRAIMASEFIDRGKEVLTGSMDGTIRLWNVAEEKQISIWGSDRYSGVESMKLSKDRTLLLGLSSSRIQILNLKTSETLQTLFPPMFPIGEPPKASDNWKQTSFGSVTTLDFDERLEWVAAGGRNGVIAIWDLKKLNLKDSSDEKDEKIEEITNPAIEASGSKDGNEGLIAFWKRNDATVNEVKFVPQNRSSNQDSQVPDLLVSTLDGLPYRVSLEQLFSSSTMNQDETSDLEPQLRIPIVTEEFCGWEVENTQSIQFDQSWGNGKGRTIVGGAHGEVRIY